jgi:hypothetical protein
MKKLLLLLFVGLAVSAEAQNYRVVTEQLPAYYQTASAFGQAPGIKAFAITFSLPGQDTMFITFNTIRDTTEPASENCLDGESGSVMGRKILQQSNRTVFFNFQKDSIFLRNDTKAGDSWIFYTFPNGGFIRALHQQTIQMDVLGMEDTVKRVTFLRKDAEGNTIEDEINHKELLLSAHNGLIQSFDLYLFPEKLLEISLIGIENPETGVRNPDAKAVYDFNVGDEFHLSSEVVFRDPDNPDSTGNIIEGDIVKKIRLLTARDDYPDSVVYQYHDCSKVIRYHQGAPDTLLLTEEISETIVFDSIRPGLLDAYPDEKIIRPNGYTYYSIGLVSTSKYNFHLQKIIVDDAYSNSGSCITESLFDPCCYTETYVEGCGGPYFYWDDWSGTTKKSKLEYFNKGGNEWGVRLAKDCEELFLDIADHNVHDPLVRIYPNPFTDELLITTENSGRKMKQLSLLDMQGRLLKKIEPDALHFSINTTVLPSGIFILEIQFEDGKLFRRKLIKNNR